MINYVDKMADALVDVLKYSNQDVEWVEPDDMKPNDGKIILFNSVHIYIPSVSFPLSS